MAITATVTIEDSGSLGSGNAKWAVGTITTTGTYATGGFSVVTPTGDADMERIATLKASGGGRLLEWDAPNQLLLVKAWATAGATVAASEITAGTTVTETYRFWAVGQ